MLTDFSQVALLLVGMLSASDAVEFVQFDILGRDVGDDLLVGGLGLDTGALNPSLGGSRMNAFDASHGLRTQLFEPSLDGALDFLFGGLEVVGGRAEAVAESLPTLPATEDKDRLAAPKSVAAVIG